jgi:hypothetical protein
MSGIAESEKPLPEPRLIPPAAAAPDHAEDGLEPSHTG